MLNFFKSLTVNKLDGTAIGVTTGIAALGAWVIAQAGAILPVLIVLIVAMILDYATGMVKAGIAGTINSTRGWTGLLKKLMYAVTVAVAFVADYVVYFAANQFGLEFTAAAYFAMLVSVWLIINEAISILENLSEIGVPMPGFLVKIFQRVKSKIEEKGDAETEQKSEN